MLNIAYSRNVSNCDQTCTVEMKYISPSLESGWACVSGKYPITTQERWSYLPFCYPLIWNKSFKKLQLCFRWTMGIKSGFCAQDSCHFPTLRTWTLAFLFFKIGIIHDSRLLCIPNEIICPQILWNPEGPWKKIIANPYTWL